MDAATAAFIASCKEKEGATKKLPTIFKYNGNAKDVYVCGKLHLLYDSSQKLEIGYFLLCIVYLNALFILLLFQVHLIIGRS